MHAELVPGLGEQVNRKRVARLMLQAGLQGIHRRKGRKNVVNAATEEDLVHRQFTVPGLGVIGRQGARPPLLCPFPRLGPRETSRWSPAGFGHCSVVLTADRDEGLCRRGCPAAYCAA